MSVDFKWLDSFLYAIEVISKCSISIGLPQDSIFSFYPDRASQIILKVIVPPAILFIQCHVSIPEVSLDIGILCLFQQVMVFLRQVDQIADAFHWFLIFSFLLSYPVSQPVIEIVCFCSASIHRLFQTVDGSIDILVLYLSIF